MGFCERRWAQVEDLSPNCLPVCPRKLANQVTVCACVLSRFSCIRLYKTLWTVARQASLSMGILQARILEWVAMPSSRESSQPRDRIRVSLTPALAAWFFTTSATWEALLYGISYAL